MSISPYADSQATYSIENESKYHETVNTLNNLVLTSENREVQYQGLAITHFTNHHYPEGLKAVSLAENYAKEKGTAPLSIYLALFLRAKYNSSSNNLADLELAEKDLLQISKLKNISSIKQAEIHLLSNQVAQKLLVHKKNVLETNKKLGIPCEQAPIFYTSLYAPNLNRFLSSPYRIKCKQNRVKICPEAQKRWRESSFDECKEIIKSYRSLMDLANQKCSEAELLKEVDLEEAGRLYREAEILIDQATESNHPEMVLKSKHSLGLIQAHFKNYLWAFECFNDAILCEPKNNDLEIKKAKMEQELMKLGPRERLAWVDPLLISSPNDQFLLLFKAEAHFLLDEELDGVITAKKLLKILPKTAGSIYELVFAMANALSFFYH